MRIALAASVIVGARLTAAFGSVDQASLPNP
jgi:hypothetical protein